MSSVRTPEETAARMLALIAVSGVAQGVERMEVVDWLITERLWEFLTPTEVGFLKTEAPTERENINFSWQMECVYVLAWALRIQKTLSTPTEQTSIASILDDVPALGEPTTEFIRGAKLRESEVILSATEEYASMHARARHPRRTTQLDIEVIQERHRALNWLAMYEELPWDDVTTDA